MLRSQGPRSLSPRKPNGPALECFSDSCHGNRVRVRLMDLRRAFRRLIARLPDESEAGVNFIIFRTAADHLEIVSGGTSETMKASVAYPGEARVPCSVFRGIGRTLRFYRGRTVSVTSSKGLLSICRTEFRYPTISLVQCGQQGWIERPHSLLRFCCGFCRTLLDFAEPSPLSSSPSICPEGLIIPRSLVRVQLTLTMQAT
jgi:hypothetical protein